MIRGGSMNVYFAERGGQIQPQREVALARAFSESEISQDVILSEAKDLARSSARSHRAVNNVRGGYLISPSPGAGCARRKQRRARFFDFARRLAALRMTDEI
jgi:hypothetical protein